MIYDKNKLVFSESFFTGGHFRIHAFWVPENVFDVYRESLSEKISLSGSSNTFYFFVVT